MRIVRPPTPMKPSAVSSACCSPVVAPTVCTEGLNGEPAYGLVNGAYDLTVNNGQLVPLFPGSLAQSAPFYQALVNNVTDPFIKMEELQNLRDIVGPTTKFIGSLHKLSSSMLWQYMTFTIDGAYFVCFRSDMAVTSCSDQQPISVLSAQPIDTVLPLGDGAFAAFQPKWAIPIASMCGIYVLQNGDIFQSCSLIAPSALRIVQIAERAASGLLDPNDPLGWLNVIPFVQERGHVSLTQMWAFAQSAVQHTFMVLAHNCFYVLRAPSQQQLYTWLSVLSAKWLLWNDRVDQPPIVQTNLFASE